MGDEDYSLVADGEEQQTLGQYMASLLLGKDQEKAQEMTWDQRKTQVGMTTKIDMSYITLFIINIRAVSRNSVKGGQNPNFFKQGGAKNPNFLK